MDWQKRKQKAAAREEHITHLKEEQAEGVKALAETVTAFKGQADAKIARVAEESQQLKLDVVALEAMNAKLDQLSQAREQLKQESRQLKQELEALKATQETFGRSQTERIRVLEKDLDKVWDKVFPEDPVTAE